HLSIQRQFVNTSRIGIRRIQYLVRPGCNANRPWSAVLRGCCLGCRNVPLGRTYRGVERHIDRDCPNEGSIRVEHLNSAVTSIGDVDISLCVCGDAMWSIKLARLCSAISPLL